MLPLRREDIPHLVPAEIDSEQFLNYIDEKALGPLAPRPLTLGLLAQLWNAPDGQAMNRSQLFRQGLLLLCREQDAARRERDRTSRLTARQRLLVAERIAAFSVFAGLPMISLDHEHEDSSVALDVEDCLVGPQHAEAGELTLDLHAVRETIATSVFVGRGPQVVTVGHATYSEFLAAGWLLRHRMSKPQLQTLLFSPHGRMYPQVRQVGIWLTALSPVEHARILLEDPETALSAVELQGDGLKRSLVARLFILAEENRLLDQWGTRYSHFSHATLTEQVRPHLSGVSEGARRLAVSLASDCKLVGLTKELNDLMLDAGHNGYERVMAASALAQIDPSGAQLVQLVAPDPVPHGEDPTVADELFGTAILALVPRQLTPAEALTRLRPRRNPSLYGMHGLAVRHVAELLGDDDLDGVCAWLESDAASSDDHEFEVLRDACLEIALKNFTRPQARHALKVVATERMRRHAPLFAPARRGSRSPRHNSHGVLPVAVRRDLALDIMRDAPEGFDADDMVSYGDSGVGLLDSQDFAWLVEQYELAPGSPDLRKHLARCLQLTYVFPNDEHGELLASLPTDHPIMADVLGYVFSGVQIQSAAADEARRLWSLRFYAEQEEADSSDEEINAKLVECIGHAKSGRHDAFWFLVRLLTIRPGTVIFNDFDDPDPTVYGRWAELAPAAQEGVLQLAVAYLNHAEHSDGDWTQDSHAH